MLQHGRRTNQSQSPLNFAAELAEEQKLGPPDHFNEQERAEWAAILARLGEGWVPRECRSMLVSYVSINVTLNAINKDLSAFAGKLPNDPLQRKRFEDLLRLRGPLTLQAATLATKLRLAPSTRNDRDRSATDYRRRMERSSTGTKPWDDIEPTNAH